jgi:excisionase family DNA binding protein
MTKDLAVSEAAELLGVAAKTVQRLARRGAFPNAYKGGTGGRTSPIRIPLADLQNYRALQPRAAA